MPLTTNYQYFQPSLGSLTGFDQFNLVSNPTNIAVLGWSVEELRAYLLNLNEANFPSKEWVLSVDDEIANHLIDYNNPHQVTVNQVTTNFVEDILQSLVPGTVPQTAPFYAFDASLKLSIGEIFPATFSSVNFYRLDLNGILQNPSTELEKIGSDESLGFSGIPLFGSCVNTVPTNWISLSTTPINTTTTQQANVQPGYMPGYLYDVEETYVAGYTGYFGVAIPTAATANSSYTMTVFLKASTTYPGYVKIQQASDVTNFATVSLNNGSVTASTSAIQVDSTMYPTGIIKVCFTFTAAATPDQTVTINFFDASIIVPVVRSGIISRNIFSVGYATVTQTGIDHPLMIDPTIPSSTSALTANLSTFTSVTAITNFTMVLSFWMYPSLATSTTDTVLFSMDTISLTRDKSHVYLHANGNLLGSTPILSGLNNFAISYSPTTVIFKDIPHTRQTFLGTYPNINTTLLSVGPCGGYLLNYALYAVNDTSQNVEFLVNA